MSVPDRAAARTALAAGLQTGVGSLLPAGTSVLRYKPMNPKGLSPVIGVQSTGTGVAKKTAQGSQADFKMSIVLLVNLTGAASEAEAEDELDALWLAVQNFLETNAGTTANWISCVKNGDSAINYFLPQAGVVYLQESIPVRLTIM